MAGLSQNVSELTAENEAKAATVASQDKALNAAWFVFGTKSELKDQKILEKGDVLKSADFNKDYLLRLIFVLIRKSSCILNAPNC